MGLACRKALNPAKKTPDKGNERKGEDPPKTEKKWEDSMALFPALPEGGTNKEATKKRRLLRRPGCGETSGV